MKEKMYIEEMITLLKGGDINFLEEPKLIISGSNFKNEKVFFDFAEKLEKMIQEEREKCTK